VRLASRFSVLFGLLAVIVAGLLTAAWSGLLDGAAQERVVDRLRSEDTFLAQLAAPLFERPAELDALVRSAGKELNVRVTAIAPSGVVLSDSEVPPAGVPRMENHGTRPEVLQARDRGMGSSRRFSATLDRNFIYLAEKVELAGRTAGYMRLAFPVDRVHAEESSAVWLGRAAIWGACLLLFLVGSYASRRFSAPLRRVTEAALAVARGDLKREPPEEDEPEAAALSEAVRRMKESLLSSLAAAESEQRLTTLAFDRLPSGIVVLGGRGEILQANASFCRMLGCPDPSGHPLIDLVREPRVNALFRRAIEGGEEGTQTWLRPDEVTWEVDVLALPSGAARGRALGIFRDVTPRVRTEMMRQRFVSDVSHELRTPVASIAAAAETLVEGSPEAEEAGHLTDLIARQARRMRELIEDLTDLSRIESGAIELHDEEVPLAALARDVCRDLEVRAAERSVRLEVEGDASIAVKGDRRRLSQILHNLADNAIKFSPEGEAVRIGVSRAGGTVRLTVADRGSGVPRSEREKIFQRFYQVDPSRSKARPGTGLGLAIVKHLAALHHAAVEVGDGPGGGALFVVAFPAA
jgi:two-component system phosphate regulon sensor histidine kinase PhoR